MATIVRKVINTDKCPQASAPLSQAVVAGRLVYCSGILGKELNSPRLIDGGVRAQTAMALEYLTFLLEAAGSSIANVVKTTILLADMNDYAIVNDEYKKVFSQSFPARTCFAVSKLPMGAAVEIEAVAIVGDIYPESTKLTSKM